MNDVRSLILATVIDVNGGPISYPSCSFCHTKVHEDNSSSSGERRFVCTKCRKTIPNCQVNHRFRVSLRIAEGCTECDVTIFGSCLDRVLGAAAEKFVQFQYNLQQNGFSSTQIQDLILQVFSNRLIGQKYYFGFRIPKTAKGRTLEYVIETAPSCGIVAHQIVTIDEPIRSVYADLKSEAEKAWRQCHSQQTQKCPDEDPDLTASQSILDNRSAFDFSSMSSVNYSNQQLSLGLASFETSILSQGVTPRSVARMSNMTCNASVHKRKNATSFTDVNLNVETPHHFIPALTVNLVEKGSKNKSCASMLHSEDPSHASEGLSSKDSQFCCANELNENDKSNTDVPKNCDNFSEILFSKDSQVPVVTDVSKSVETRQSMNFLLPPVNWKYKSRIPVRDNLSESLFSKESHVSCVGSNISKSSYALQRQSSSVGRVGSRGRWSRISGGLCVSRASTMADIPSEIFSETLFSVDSRASIASPAVEKRIHSAEIRTCALNSDSETCARSKLQTENFSESLFSQESQFDSFVGFADVDVGQKERHSCVDAHEHLRNNKGSTCTRTPGVRRCSEPLLSEEIPVLDVASANKLRDIGAVEVGIDNDCIPKDCVVTPVSRACSLKSTSTEGAQMLEGDEHSDSFSEEIRVQGGTNASKCCAIARNARVERTIQDSQKECSATGNDSLFSEEIPVLGVTNASRDCDSAMKDWIKGKYLQEDHEDCAITSKSNASGAVTLEKSTSNLKSMANECSDNIFSEEIPFLDDLDCKGRSFNANFKKPVVPNLTLCLAKSAVNVDLKNKTKPKDLNPETFCMWDLLAGCSDYVVMPEDEDDEIAQDRLNRISNIVQDLNPTESEQLVEFLCKCDNGASRGIRVKGNNSIVLSDNTRQRSATSCGVGEQANLNARMKGGVCKAAPPESENIDEFLGKCDDIMSDSEMCSSSFEDSKLLHEVFALENDIVGEVISKDIVEITVDCSSGCKKDLATSSKHLKKVIESEKSCITDSVFDFSSDLFTPTPKSFHVSGSHSLAKKVGKCDIYQEIGQSHENVQVDSGLGHSASQLNDKYDQVPTEQGVGFIDVPEKDSIAPVTDYNIQMEIATNDSQPFGKYLEPKKLMIQFDEASQDLWSQDLLSSPTQTLKSPIVLGSNGGQRIGDKMGKGMPRCHFGHTDAALPVAFTQKIAAPNNVIVCGVTDSESPGIVFKTPLDNIRKCSFRKSKLVLNQTSTPLSMRNISSDLKISSQVQRKSTATGITSAHCENRTPLMPVLNSTENSLLKRPKSSLKNLRTFSPLTTSCKFLKMSDNRNVSVFDSPTIKSLRKTVRFAEKFLRNDKENLSCLSDSVLLLAAGEENDNGGSGCSPVGEGSLVQTHSKNYSPHKMQTPNSKTNQSMYQSHSPDLFSSMDDSMFEAHESHEGELFPFEVRGESWKSRNGHSQRRESLLCDKSLPALSFDVSGDLFSD